MNELLHSSASLSNANTCYIRHTFNVGLKISRGILSTGVLVSIWGSGWTILSNPSPPSDERVNCCRFRSRYLPGSWMKIDVNIDGRQSKHSWTLVNLVDGTGIPNLTKAIVFKFDFQWRFQGTYFSSPFNKRKEEKELIFTSVRFFLALAHKWRCKQKILNNLFFLKL